MRRLNTRRVEAGDFVQIGVDAFQQIVQPAIIRQAAFGLELLQFVA
jgi:hypothetical protein